MSIRDEKVKEILRDMAARYFLHNASGASLLTVTSVVLSARAKYATIFFTVFPAGKTAQPTEENGDKNTVKNNLEKTALEFAKRKRSEFKAFLRENSSLGIVPQIDFEIDLGEKNRQRIDELLSQDAIRQDRDTDLKNEEEKEK